MIAFKRLNKQMNIKSKKVILKGAVIGSAMFVLGAGVGVIQEIVVPKVSAPKQVRPAFAPQGGVSGAVSSSSHTSSVTHESSNVKQPEVHATAETDVDVSQHQPVNPEYVVQAGDTLSQIALDKNADVGTLAAANYLADINHIETGQTLVIK